MALVKKASKAQRRFQEVRAVFPIDISQMGKTTMTQAKYDYILSTTRTRPARSPLRRMTATLANHKRQLKILLNSAPPNNKNHFLNLKKANEYV